MTIRPYYADDAVTIYHADMTAMLPISADVVITDPPYGIGDAPRRGQGKTGKRRGVMGKRFEGVSTWHPPAEWDKALNPEWMRLVAESAPVVAWFGQWRKRDKVASMMPLPLRAEVVWAKDCHTGAPSPVASRDERIWLFSRAGIKPHTFETSVWDEKIIPTFHHRWHRNEKPVSLMARLIAFLAAPDDTVLDPFMGSGSTLVAAKVLGRRAIGIEVDERHCESAAKRCAQDTLGL